MAAALGGVSRLLARLLLPTTRSQWQGLPCITQTQRMHSSTPLNRASLECTASVCPAYYTFKTTQLDMHNSRMDITGE
jgi:hypothetical protein